MKSPNFPTASTKEASHNEHKMLFNSISWPIFSLCCKVFFNDTVVKEQKNPESPNGMRGKMRMEEMDSPNSCLLENY